MDEITRLLCTRGLQFVMLIPLILAIRQLYRDVYDNESDTWKDPDKN